MRLIDADALMKEIKSSFCKACIKYCRSCDIDDFISYIDDAPTIDAVPVVHGHWIKNSGNSYTVKCSNCKSERILSDSWFEYCPRCGARKDGDSSD